ncbi:MAG: OmpA family protein, partial [Spirochaetales bacterium]|nr:OmpA family protein [Spirochaetales bacterium]
AAMDTPEPAPTDTVPPLNTSTPVEASKATSKPENTPAVTKASVDTAMINKRLVEMGNLHFVPNSTELLEESSAKFPQIVSFLKEYKGKIYITLYGHTASYGSVNEQEQLAFERAKTIYTRLVRNGAIDSSLCDYKGMGSRQPITDLTDEEHIYLNRRVEIKVRIKD